MRFLRSENENKIRTFGNSELQSLNMEKKNTDLFANMLQFIDI